MRVVLEGGEDQVVQVANWPFSLFYLSDNGEVFLTGENGPRKFDGSGHWYYQTGRTAGEKEDPELILNFDTGTPQIDVPSRSQALGIGGTPENPVLFEMGDPDTCPRVVYRR